MSFWRQIALGFRSLLHRSTVEQETSEEIHHYLEEITEAHMARGLSREEAERKVRLEMGSHFHIKEQVRSYGWENVIQTFFVDLRYTCRQLRSLPLFTAVTVLTIALGVGVTTTIFGAISAILLQPLPYPDSNQIATISEMNRDGSRNDGTFGMYRGFLERARSFESIAVFRPWRPTLTGSGQPERLDGQRVTASYFDVLGIHPVMGREFNAQDDRLNGPNEVIVSAGFSQRRFGGSGIGRQLILDDTSYTIIGILPKDFENVLAPSAEVWRLLQYDMSLGSAWGHHLRTIGRLRRGITPDHATDELNRIGNSVLKEQNPETYGQDVKWVASPLQQDITHAARPALLAIMGAAILVLLIACVNVTNLLLARSVQRRTEFAMRAALGAGRSRLIRQLFTESLLLAVMGGATGIAIATLGTRALITVAPPELPRIDAIGVDSIVFLFGFFITTFIGLAFGWIPARYASSSTFYQELQYLSKGNTSFQTRARRILVVGEIALAMVLLISSGLLWRSLERFFAVDAGFDPSNVLTMQVQTSGQRFKSTEDINRFFSQSIEAMQRIPGVTIAAFTSQLPLSGDLDEYGVHFQATASQPAATYSAFRYAVSPEYFQTMQIPFRSGRSFDANDRAATPFVAVISESLANLRFPHMDPMGQKLRIGPTDGPLYTIIGVVKDVKQQSLALNQAFAVYIPATQWFFPDNTMSIVVRCGDATVSPAELRQAIWSVDKNQPIVRIAWLDDLVNANASSRRFAMMLFQVFAVAALILAAAGIYGLLAGSVAERTREIGVRSALGASQREIIMMIVRQGITLTGLGVVFGLVFAAVATQSITALLFEVSPLDVVTYLSVIVILAFVAIIASGFPAWRASCIDPAITLRTE